MKTISLIGKYGLGKVALIDDEDWPLLSQYSWWVSDLGYAIAKINNKNIRMHRFILPASKLVVDHINHDSLDNQKSNLRLCTIAQNQANKKGSRGSKINYKGVILESHRPKPYRAQLKRFGKLIFLGYHSTAEAAARAYDKKAKELHGEYAYLNFPK